MPPGHLFRHAVHSFDQDLVMSCARLQAALTVGQVRTRVRLLMADCRLCVAAWLLFSPQSHSGSSVVGNQRSPNSAAAEYFSGVAWQVLTATRGLVTVGLL